MDSKALVTRIASLIIGLSLLNVIISFILDSPFNAHAIRDVMINIGGLIINLVLAFFLIAGHGWARWFTVLRCGFGAVFSWFAWTQDNSVHQILRPTQDRLGHLWLLFTALSSAAIGVYLVFSKRVNEHFNPNSGF